MNTLFETHNLIESYTKILFKKWDRIKELRNTFYFNSNDEWNSKNGYDSFVIPNSSIKQNANSKTQPDKTSKQKLFYIDILYQFYYAQLNYQYTYQQIHATSPSQPTPNQNASNISEEIIKSIPNDGNNCHTSLSFEPEEKIILSSHQLHQNKITLTKQYLEDMQILCELRIQLLEKSKLVRSWLYKLKDFQFKLLFYILKRTNNNNETDKVDIPLTSSEISLINEIQLLLITISNEIPSLIDESQQEKIISKIDEYTRYLQKNNKILSFNPNLYYIFKNSHLYKDRIKPSEEEKEDDVNSLSPLSSKEYYLKYYQQHYHNKNSNIAVKREESMATAITNTTHNSSSIKNYSIQEEDSWADIASKSGYSMTKSPQLTEIYKPTLRSSPSLDSFTSSQEEVDSLDNDHQGSLYSHSDLIPSMDSFMSTSKMDKGILPVNKLKSMNSNANTGSFSSYASNSINNNILPISTTFSSKSLATTTTTTTTTKSLLIPLDTNYNPKPDYHSYLTLSPIQAGIATTSDSLTSLTNINSEMYHDNNSYSEQVNRSKLDLQKIIKDNSLASPRHGSSGGNSNGYSLSRLPRTSLDINIPTSPSLSSPKSRTPTTPRTPKTPKNHHPSSDILKDSNYQEPESITTSSHSPLTPTFKSTRPYLLYKNTSFIHSDPTLASTISATASNFSSNGLVDLFLVTKPKKVGLNILNQHIEYAVIARKFGEKDVIGYKRYSDFVKLRDHLYSLCQKRSITKKKNTSIASSSSIHKRTSFNHFLKKEKSYDNDRFLAYNEVNLSKEEKRKSTTSIEINKLIKAFGSGHGSHQGSGNRSFSHERNSSIEDTFDLDLDVSHQQQQQHSHPMGEEDDMTIVNRVLPPFPQKKIVGKFNIKFVEKRRESLQTFLNDILKEPSLEFLIITIKQWITNEITL